MPAGLSALMGQVAATTVLVLLNMVVEEELKDDEEYEGRPVCIFMTCPFLVRCMCVPALTSARRHS